MSDVGGLNPVSQQAQQTEQTVSTQQADMPDVAPSTPISYGDQGEEVAAVQNILTATGADLGKEAGSGVFGRETERAVMELQQLNGLTPSGIVDDATLPVLVAVAEETLSGKGSQVAPNPAQQGVQTAPTDQADSTGQSGAVDQSAPVAAQQPGGAQVPAYSELFGNASWVRDGSNARLLELAGGVVQRAPELAGTRLAQNIESGTITRDDMRELQTFLQGQGHDVGRTGVDGKYGPLTHGALQAFMASPTAAAAGAPATQPAGPGASAPPLGPVVTSQPVPTDSPISRLPGTSGTGAAASVSSRVTTPHGSIAATDLSDRQARAELEALQAAGVIEFENRSEGRIRLTNPVAGVTFHYVGRETPRDHIYSVIPRMAVATARLAMWGRERGVDVMTTRGFGGRSGSRHNEGIAVDIAGFRGTDPTTGQRFDYDVLRDWGQAPDRGSGYRLDRSTGAGAFFYDAHAFMTQQFKDHRRGPTSIGDASYIITPDHPNPGLASGHRDHFHIEVDRN